MGRFALVLKWEMWLWRKGAVSAAPVPSADVEGGVHEVYAAASSRVVDHKVERSEVRRLNGVGNVFTAFCL